MHSTILQDHPVVIINEGHNESYLRSITEIKSKMFYVCNIYTSVINCNLICIIAKIISR